MFAKNAKEVFDALKGKKLDRTNLQVSIGVFCDGKWENVTCSLVTLADVLSEFLTGKTK